MNDGSPSLLKADADADGEPGGCSLTPAAADQDSAPAPARVDGSMQPECAAAGSVSRPKADSSHAETGCGCGFSTGTARFWFNTEAVMNVSTVVKLSTGAVLR